LKDYSQRLPGCQGKNFAGAYWIKAMISTNQLCDNR